MPPGLQDYPSPGPVRSLWCAWPAVFTQRRNFSREAEDEPYINHLQKLRLSDEQEYDEEEGEEEDEVDKEHISSECDESDNYEEVSPKSGRGVEWDRSQINVLTESWNRGNQPSIVRLFMRGSLGEEDDFTHRDQVEKVARFCEEVQTPDRNLREQHVALLDDRNCMGIVPSNEAISPSGTCRPYLGPLTAERLRQELSKKRFGRTTSDNAFDFKKDDVERRLIFITNLNPHTILALVTTASRTQVAALKDLLYQHITGRASIGVTIPSIGFCHFSLHFHLPYFVLRRSNNLVQDHRRRSDGVPLRQSWNLPCLSDASDMSLSTSTNVPYVLYEAQISVSVTGLDDYVWTAYACVDNYFGSEESVEHYDGPPARYQRCRRPDPLTAGQMDAEEPIWTPREYFMKVFLIRVNQVTREWIGVVDKVKKEIESSRMIQYQLPSDGLRARKVAHDPLEWNIQMVQLLRKLISSLSDTVGAWDEFRGRELGYFLPNNSHRLKYSIIAADKAFGNMNIILSKLQKLEKELCQDSPQGLNAHFSLRNDEVQRKRERNLQILTIIIIVFSPLSLATSIFSVPAVLPFPPSLSHFAIVLLIVGVLVWSIPLILVDWKSWLHPTNSTAKPTRLKLPGQVERLDDLEEVEQERKRPPVIKAAWALKIALALKRSFLPHRYKNSDLGFYRDLERGCEEPFLRSPRLENVLDTPRLSPVSPSEGFPDPLSSLMGWDRSSKSKPPARTAIRESLGSHGLQYRLSESHEDHLNPKMYKKKLSGLRAHVGEHSGMAAQGSNTGRGEPKTEPTPQARLHECRNFLKSILENINVLCEAGFCFSTATYLRLDQNRAQVAVLESLQLGRVAQLEDLINELKTPLEILRRLDRACKDLLGDCLVPSTPQVAGSIALVSLRLLDLFLVSHVCSHMGDLGNLMINNTSIGRKFHISSRASSIAELSVPVDTGTMAFSRRTLKCLNGFLCGQQVWVLHSSHMDPQDATELFLSTDPDTFADVWGPMWKITSQGKPMEILRYDLDHGSVVPLSLISGSGESTVKIEPSEELCHWIPNFELEKFEKAWTKTAPPQICHSRLLIGACLHSVVPNPKDCYCNMTAVNKGFIDRGHRRQIGSSPVRWATESVAIGTTIGGGGLGLPVFQYSQTMKKDGVPVREAFFKHWKNASPRNRPWSCLRLRYGLQVSVCTGNSRRVELFELLAGGALKELMRSDPNYPNEAWRVDFEKIRDPAELIRFQANKPAEREHFQQYITDCLEVLMGTGIGSRANDGFVALWIYNGQPWEVTLPRRYHAWSGFAEDNNSICSFIVFEKCLVNAVGLMCCHSRENMPRKEAQRMRRDTPPVFETFLAISDLGELPNGLRLVPGPDQRLQWSIGDLWNRRHSIKLGKRGRLEGKDSRSLNLRTASAHPNVGRVMTGKWVPEGRIEATSRFLTGFITTPTETGAHTEHISDGQENEPYPLPYHIVDET